MDVAHQAASKIYTDIHYKIRRDIDTFLGEYLGTDKNGLPHAFSDKPYADRITFNLSIVDPLTYGLYIGDSIRILYRKEGYIIEQTDSFGDHSFHTCDWRRVESFVDAHFA